MTYVVERCPRCGVEHEGTRGRPACEACDTPLRAWCRAHSREVGWLDGPTCPRCAEAALRPPPRPRAAAAFPCPDVSHALAPAASPVAPAADGAAAPEVLAGAALSVKPTGPVGHLFVMLLILLMTVGGGTLLGVIAGFVYVFAGAGGTPGAALPFALAGAGLGLLFGGYSCWDYVKHLPASPR